MRTELKFRCPQCQVGLQALEENAGRSFDCPQCTTSLTVPATHALVPVAPPVIVAELVEDDEEQHLARQWDHPDDGTKPVELRLGNLAGMKVDVDKKTRNALATTFLGGLLVALGAIVFAMFGGKKS